MSHYWTISVRPFANERDEGEAIASSIGDDLRKGVRPSEVAVLVSHAKGFSLADGSPFPVGAGAFSLAPGDVNGDEKLDFVTSSFTTERLTVLLAR